MKHDRHEEQRRAAKRTKVIRTAEWVLAQAYRSASRLEMIESQLRIREGIVREMRRRTR